MHNFQDQFPIQNYFGLKFHRGGWLEQSAFYICFRREKPRSIDSLEIHNGFAFSFAASPSLCFRFVCLTMLRKNARDTRHNRKLPPYWPANSFALMSVQWYRHELNNHPRTDPSESHQDSSSAPVHRKHPHIRKKCKSAKWRNHVSAICAKCDKCSGMCSRICDRLWRIVICSLLSFYKWKVCDLPNPWTC